MLNTIVDLSHHNQLDLKDLYAQGIRAVIHKITQSNTFTDDHYKQRAESAQKLGMQWGAYHFLAASDMQKQFDFFFSKMETLTPKGFDIIPCLDWEPNTTSGQQTASFEQLLEMVNLCKESFGKYPTIYGGYWMIDQLKDKTSTLLGKCPLWQANYREKIEFPHSIWNTWNFWQYTDGSKDTGIFKNIDRDYFNGDDQEMTQFWQDYSISW